MRRLWFIAMVAFALLVPAISAHAADIEPYRGLGAWVDVFDYAPRVQTGGKTPPVNARSIGDMAKLGVRTLYLQVGRNDAKPARTLVDGKQVREFLGAAHQAGIAVVAWYLPSLVDIDADFRPLEGIHRLRVNGRGFDGIALDMEATDVPDVTLRNSRLVQLTRRVRKLVGSDMPIGAIVYPAVQLEVLNLVLWPGFPYRQVEPSIDVWLPMVYFTFRSEAYRDPIKYTTDSVDLLRGHLHDANAAVHVIGGIADLTTTDDYRAFVRAAKLTKAVGYSVYDYNTTASSAWPWLRPTSG
ncbi:MAG: hypothetical protein ACHQDE_04340 [Acidimicrobiia bacterium]